MSHNPDGRSGVGAEELNLVGSFEIVDFDDLLVFAFRIQTERENTIYARDLFRNFTPPKRWQETQLCHCFRTPLRWATLSLRTDSWPHFLDEFHRLGKDRLRRDSPLSHGHTLGYV